MTTAIVTHPSKSALRRLGLALETNGFASRLLVDGRLVTEVSPAVLQAAMQVGLVTGAKVHWR